MRTLFAALLLATLCTTSFAQLHEINVTQLPGVSAQLSVNLALPDFPEPMMLLVFNERYVIWDEQIIVFSGDSLMAGLSSDYILTLAVAQYPFLVEQHFNDAASAVDRAISLMRDSASLITPVSLYIAPDIELQFSRLEK